MRVFLMNILMAHNPCAYLQGTNVIVSNLYTWGWKMAWSLKCLQHMHEFDPRTHIEDLDGAAHICNPGAARVKTGRWWLELTDRLA